MSTVLLIEVDALVRDTLTKALERQGHEVEATDDVRHAMAWMAQNSPDVVMTELIVGHGTSGSMLLDYARSSHPRAVRILMSSHPVLDSRQHAHNHDVYLAKPFSIGVIASTLRDLSAPRCVRAA